MGTFPLRMGSRYVTEGTNAAASKGQEIDTGAVAHTKGAWAQVDASTAHDAYGITVHITDTTADQILVDIGVGAAASEKVIAPNLLHSNLNRLPCKWDIPIFIPAGTRIAARAQRIVAASLKGYIEVTLWEQGLLHSGPLSRVTAYGIDTTATRGSLVDPGATPNVKGAYTQIVASTTNDIRAMLIAFTNRGDFTIGESYTHVVDVAVGAAASEKIIIDNLLLAYTDTNDSINTSPFGPIPCFVPAGTRLAVRSQALFITGDANDRTFDCAIYGVD